LPHCCTLAWGRFGTAPWGPAWAHFCTLALAHCCTLASGPAWKLCCTAVLAHWNIVALERWNTVALERWNTVALEHCYTVALAHSYTPALARLSIPVWELVLQHCCTPALGPGDKQEQQLHHIHPKLHQSFLRSLRVPIHQIRRWTLHRWAGSSRRPHRRRCCRPAR